MQKASFNVFDDEFAIYVKCAKQLVDKLYGQEKYVAISWLKRLTSLNSTDLMVKKDRNHLMRRLFDVMKKSVLLRIIHHPKSEDLTRHEMEIIKDELANLIQAPHTAPHLNHFFYDDKESSSTLSMWSNDRRIYVATRPIAGRGALIYMAVAEDPESGWIIPRQKNQKQ